MIHEPITLGRLRAALTGNLQIARMHLTNGNRILFAMYLHNARLLRAMIILHR